jgi:hypothetical protein
MCLVIIYSAANNQNRSRVSHFRRPRSLGYRLPETLLHHGLGYGHADRVMVTVIQRMHSGDSPGACMSVGTGT